MNRAELTKFILELVFSREPHEYFLSNFPSSFPFHPLTSFRTHVVESPNISKSTIYREMSALVVGRKRKCLSSGSHLKLFWDLSPGSRENFLVYSHVFPHILSIGFQSRECEAFTERWNLSRILNPGFSQGTCNTSSEGGSPSHPSLNVHRCGGTFSQKIPMAIVNLLGASCTNFVNSILPLGFVFSPCFYYLWLLNFCLISTFCIFFSSFVLIFLWCIFASHILDEIKPWIYPSSYPVHSLLTSFYWKRLLNTLSKKTTERQRNAGNEVLFLSVITDSFTYFHAQIFCFERKAEMYQYCSFLFLYPKLFFYRIWHFSLAL